VARLVSTLLVLGLLGGTAAAFAVTEHLKLVRSPIYRTEITNKVFSPVCRCSTQKSRIRFYLRRADRLTLSIENGDQTLNLEAKKRAAVTMPVSAVGFGTGTIGLTLTGPEGFTLARQYELTVKPSTQVLARRTVKPLGPGQSLSLSSDVFADLVPGTGKVSLSVTPSGALDVATLLAALDRYPLGCTEQIVSRALPLL